MKLFGLRCLGCVAVVSLIAASAGAEPIVWLDVGAKGAVGGQYYTEPDGIDRGAVPFDDGAGGIGGGGGIFFETRFLGQHLGLEFDLLVESNKTWCNVNDTDYVLRYTTMRLPILLKGHIVKDTSRIGFGLGPEFIPGLSAESELVGAVKRNDVALAWEFAMAFMVKKVAITFDVRFAYHFTFPKSWDERHSNTAASIWGSYEAGHTIDMHFLLGAAYQFDFGEKGGKKKSSDDEEEPEEETEDENDGEDDSIEESPGEESDSEGEDADNLDDLL